MKKCLLKVISICLFVTVVMFSIVQLAYLYRGDFHHTRKHVAGYYAEKHNTLDVVFIGASYMFSAFMPMEAWNDYGFASYNFSINTMFTESYRYYVREALKTQTPKLIVIDCGSFLADINAAEYKPENETDGISQIYVNSDALNYSINRALLLDEIMPENASKSSYYFDLLHYHSMSLPSFEYIGNKKHSVEKGYSNLPLFSDCVFVDSELIEPLHNEVPLSEKSDEDFKLLVEELKKYDTQVLFVVQPYLYVNEKGDKWQGNAEYMKRVVKENGFDFVNLRDYRDEINLNNTFDMALEGGDHFNCFGAEKITKVFGKYLSENYGLPDHRGDVKYSSWNDDYIEWSKVLENGKKSNLRYMRETLSEDYSEEKMSEILYKAKEYL